MPNVIALVPARGGSKGIPRKNLAEVAGRPLIAHTIEAALSVARISEVFVSSDDAEILKVASAMGCKPIARPPALSTDSARAEAVVDHFLTTHATLPPDDVVIVYLQPTSPLRTARHIDEALDLLADSHAHGVVSVTLLEKSPFKAFGLEKDGTMRSLFDQALSNANRQSLPPAFAPNGAIYCFTVSAYKAVGAFPSNGSLPYVMSPRDSFDVDTPADLEAVRALMEQSRA